MIVDYVMNPGGTPCKLQFSNKPGRSTSSRPKVAERARSGVEIHEADGSVTRGPVRVLPVALEPNEVRILRKVA